MIQHLPVISSDTASSQICPDQKAARSAAVTTLGQTPALLYLPVPEGNYPKGFRLELEDADGNRMSRNIGARTCAAGQLRAMPALAWQTARGIANAADFAAFAAAVNSGASTKQWENDEGVVTLLCDIDFSGVTSWRRLPSRSAVIPLRDISTAAAIRCAISHLHMLRQAQISPRKV